MEGVGLEGMSWVKLGSLAQNLWSQQRTEPASRAPSILTAPYGRSGCLWHTRAASGLGWGFPECGVAGACALQVPLSIFSLPKIWHAGACWGNTRWPENPRERVPCSTSVPHAMPNISVSYWMSHSKWMVKVAMENEANSHLRGPALPSLCWGHFYGCCPLWEQLNVVVKITGFAVTHT